MSPEICRQLRELNQAWFEVEAYFKTYETVAGEALGAAVFSLRYAGRLMARCLLIALCESPTEEQLTEMLENIINAKHYIAMTKYDIVDGVLSHIDRVLNRTLLGYGRTEIATITPNLSRLEAALDACRPLVEKSRREPERRDHLYTIILNEHLETIVADYQELNARVKDVTAPKIADERVLSRSKRALGRLSMFGVFVFFAVEILQLDGLNFVFDLTWPLWIPICVYGFYEAYAKVAWYRDTPSMPAGWRWLLTIVTLACAVGFALHAFPDRLWFGISKIKEMWPPL